MAGEDFQKGSGGPQWIEAMGTEEACLLGGGGTNRPHAVKFWTARVFRTKNRREGYSPEYSRGRTAFIATHSRGVTGGFLGRQSDFYGERVGERRYTGRAKGAVNVEECGKDRGPRGGRKNPTTSQEGFNRRAGQDEPQKSIF